MRAATVTDKRAISRWLELRGENSNFDEPDYYSVVPGVAAMGCYFVGGSTVMIDGLVTNPHCSHVTRHKAINKLLKNVEELANDYGAKRIIAFTGATDTLKRAVTSGFSVMPYAFIVKEVE
jgi:hypothetical protein